MAIQILSLLFAGLLLTIAPSVAHAANCWPTPTGWVCVPGWERHGDREWREHEWRERERVRREEEERDHWHHHGGS
jgi:hypothetical protein